MLKRWKKPWINENQFNNLLKRVSLILENSKVIVISYQNTGANWLGVKNATINMFPNQHLIIPQTYSNSLLSREQREEFAEFLKENGAQLIIFSGIPEYAINWIQYIHSIDIQIGVIYHGGVAELNGNTLRQKQIGNILNLANTNVINRIGVVKEGLKEWFEKSTNAKTFRVIPITHIPKNIKIEKYNDEKVHIGVFGNSSYNKNRHTQVIAASMIENSVVHIIAPNEFDYVLESNRIKIHENCDRKSFLKLLGSMDVNIYCSYSESWGQIVLESIALETPCLFSYNSGLHNFLGDQFLIKNCDNIQEIHSKLKSVLEKKTSLKENHEKLNLFGQDLNRKFIELD